MGAREARQKARAVALATGWEAVVANIAAAHRAVELMQPDGYPSGGGESVSGGEVGRPVEAAVLGREGMSDSRLQVLLIDDPARPGEQIEVEQLHVRGLRAVDDALRQAEQALADLRNAASQLVAPLIEKDPPPRTNIEPCRACDVTVSNTPGDRIVKGYCLACYHAWRREGFPDRFQFERRRLRRAIAADHSKSVVRDREVHGVDVWFRGIEVTLEGDLAAEYRSLEHQHGQVPAEDLERLVQAAQEAAEARIVSSLDRSVELLGGGA